MCGNEKQIKQQFVFIAIVFFAGNKMKNRKNKSENWKLVQRYTGVVIVVGLFFGSNSIMYIYNTFIYSICFSHLQKNSDTVTFSHVKREKINLKHKTLDVLSLKK